MGQGGKVQRISGRYMGVRDYMQLCQDKGFIPLLFTVKKFGSSLRQYIDYNFWNKDTNASFNKITAIQYVLRH